MIHGLALLRVSDIAASGKGTVRGRRDVAEHAGKLIRSWSVQLSVVGEPQDRHRKGR